MGKLTAIIVVSYVRTSLHWTTTEYILTFDCEVNGYCLTISELIKLREELKHR